MSWKMPAFTAAETNENFFHDMLDGKCRWLCSLLVKLTGADPLQDSNGWSVRKRGSNGWSVRKRGHNA